MRSPWVQHASTLGRLPPCSRLRWIPRAIPPSRDSELHSSVIVPFFSNLSSTKPPQLPPVASCLLSMANFPMDPLAYVPRGGVMIDGGGELRKSRNVVSLSGQHLRKHEDLAIAICDENFTALERHEFLLLIHHHLTQVLRLQVLSNSVIAMAQNLEKSLQDVIPRSLSPLSLPRPPIKLVYSRRQHIPTGSNQAPVDTDQGMASASQKRLDKGKGILLPNIPTIQNFIQASSDEQVGVGELMAPARDNVKSIPGRNSINNVGDEVDNV
ncbi:hypothetical protein GUJ93_ZPchr0007g3837 [Zizania palustris]|uniref:DUF7597 domain-containing protein n=1 Tax=Zizania palustris TaxID=103762 RepID=A0A8J5T5Y0_ZIZPA|nr:hypothetical protein GUJ93_ZPchr0007g3837 [Zizania palustris]